MIHRFLNVMIGSLMFLTCSSILEIFRTIMTNYLNKIRYQSGLLNAKLLISFTLPLIAMVMILIIMNYLEYVGKLN